MAAIPSMMHAGQHRRNLIEWKMNAKRKA